MRCCCPRCGRARGDGARRLGRGDGAAGRRRRARRIRALVKDDPEFMPFFHAATPFPELATLNLASRPVVAGWTGGLPGLEDLRAIPWVFSWTQARANLPGWFGLGSALAC